MGSSNPKTSETTQVGVGLCDRGNFDASNRLRVNFRDNTANPFNALSIWIIPGQMDIVEKYNGANYVLDTDLTADSVEDTWYDMWLKAEGANVDVYRRERGSNDAWTSVLSTSSATVTTSDRFRVAINGANLYELDDFALLTEDGDPVETVTFTVNNANELTSMNDNGTTINFTYDAWGRQTSKYTASNSADYEYRYSHKLASVTSDFPGEGTVQYNYGGDGKRRSRTAGADETWYNWAGWTVVNEENDAGTLTRTYVGRAAAQIEGSNPSTGTPYYFTSDHLGSVRGVYDASKNADASYDYSPYGEAYASESIARSTRLFTEHDWDIRTGTYFAPFRYYSTKTSRWLQKDQIKTYNRYCYIRNPVNYIDPYGLVATSISLVVPDAMGDSGPITFGQFQVTLPSSGDEGYTITWSPTDKQKKLCNGGFWGRQYVKNDSAMFDSLENNEWHLDSDLNPVHSLGAVNLSDRPGFPNLWGQQWFIIEILCKMAYKDCYGEQHIVLFPLDTFFYSVKTHRDKTQTMVFSNWSVDIGKPSDEVWD